MVERSSNGIRTSCGPGRATYRDAETDHPSNGIPVVSPLPDMPSRVATYFRTDQWMPKLLLTVVRGRVLWSGTGTGRLENLW